MWRTDNEGTELQGSKEAFKELRTRAEHAIADGDRIGLNMRQHRVRLRDETGRVLFEGALDDAARLEIDGKVYLPCPTEGIASLDTFGVG